jgi:hypothetical protein
MIELNFEVDIEGNAVSAAHIDEGLSKLEGITIIDVVVLDFDTSQSNTKISLDISFDVDLDKFEELNDCDTDEVKTAVYEMIESVVEDLDYTITLKQ